MSADAVLSAGGTLAPRVRNTVPEPIRERVRLLVAGTLERRVRRSPAIRGAAIVFHAVHPHGGDPDVEIDPPVATTRLDRAVGYLARHYELVSASELPSAARTRGAGERVPIALTFDDDLPGHLEHAAPVLERHGAGATAFLCGARSPFWWQLLQVAVDTRAIDPPALDPVPPELVEQALERRPRAIGRLAKAVEDLAPAERDRVSACLEGAVAVTPPLLGMEGAAALAARGWEIGFHTRRHDVLTVLDDRALREAIHDGREEVLGGGPRTLAYPHGKAGEREAAAAREAGYRTAYTGRAEIFTDHTDPHLIGRLQPDTGTLGRFALQLARMLSDS